MKKAVIYTGTGDCGTTSIVGGKRVPKDHCRVKAYGTLDELNAFTGLLAASLDNSTTLEFIEGIENDLLTLGSYIATEDAQCCPIGEERISELERAIDALEEELPQMRSFILPGNTEQAARANVCRTVCRRAERELVTLSGQSGMDSHALAYLNRLSDYFFLLQRTLMQGKEKMWTKPCK
jgi:cob(I)alamin adenosyltransferase